MPEKNCSKCGELKPFSEFYKHKETSDGFYGFCKSCKLKQNKNWNNSNKAQLEAYQKSWSKENKERQTRLAKIWQTENPDKVNAKAAKRRAIKKQSIPPWFEKDLVELVYKKAVELGFEVDHVYPLQGKNVCGLHCWYNLQLLDTPTNRAKSNQVWISE